MIDFTSEQLERYSRHIILKDVGVEGQIKLSEAKVLIIGAGGLGAPVALYLAAAGIGMIGILDHDRVEISNLQRQILHFTKDINVSKVISAKEKMLAINPGITVRTYQELLRADNIRDIVRSYDFIVDGSDNFPTKFLVNDACIMENIPFSHGGILRFTGQVMVIVPGETACYRCIFREAPPEGIIPSCQEAGVLGVLAGVIGTIQATEVLKMILGIGTGLRNRLLTYQALESDFREVKLKRNPDCPICGKSPVITELQDGEQRACAL
jgi:adenylyltransferase/sulfurtransferase